MNILSRFIHERLENETPIINLTEKYSFFDSMHNSPKKLTVVGDLHGCLDSLISIFALNGIPSPTNPYLFLGDYVDRGTNGVEIFLLLCMLELQSPKSITLLMGNHEKDPALHMLYGFNKEVTEKYPSSGSKLQNEYYLMFLKTFRNLPIAAILQSDFQNSGSTEGIFFVHGGIPIPLDNTQGDSNNENNICENALSFSVLLTLEPQKIIQHEYPLEPFDSGIFDENDKSNETLRLSQTECQKDIFHQLLWNDPASDKKCLRNPDLYSLPSPRGSRTFLFLEKATELFLQQNKVNYIVRAHQFVPNGHSEAHHGHVITVFSSATYNTRKKSSSANHQQDRGAVLIVRNKQTFANEKDADDSHNQWAASIPVHFERKTQSEGENDEILDLVIKEFDTSILDLLTPAEPTVEDEL
eukprot:MONOS_9893.1-p1 / transcript=MONOS_9893.1 / gene=MONOS_9893 / organism=Monocercomonoides_exilis_PA203 / gene_product=Serine / transcript_product=Serine / location=Mono_scaffold00425:12770-14008(-) / protein_length=412 / sequence_SO=supercontig / SO=protein_coding / is_pseudo=false